MKTMFTKARVAALSAVGVVSALPMTVHAALPEGVSTGIAAAQTDGLAAVGLLAGFGVAVFLIYKVLKRLGII